MTAELWSENLKPGEHWSGELRRGTSLYITAFEPRANVAAMMYNYESLPERYNLADYAEDPARAFRPSSGLLSEVRLPDNLRVDG